MQKKPTTTPCYGNSISWNRVYDSQVKCTLVQALRLCTGHMAHRGSRGIALPFHDHGTRRWWGASVAPQPLITPGKDLVPIVQEAGWPQDRSGQVRKISPPTGIRSPDRPTRSQSLYQLSYWAHMYDSGEDKMNYCHKQQSHSRKHCMGHGRGISMPLAKIFWSIC